MLKKDKTMFIHDAKHTHGDRYNYDNAIYVNSHTKIEIICYEHGSFMQLPYHHLNGHGCPKCAKCKHYDVNDMITMFNKIHDNKYKYDNFLNYKTQLEKIEIVCPEHNVFKQTVKNHLNGHGCPKCKGFNVDVNDLIIKFKQIHGDKYEYILDSYTNRSKTIKIKCIKHDYIFEQFIDNHLLGFGCSKCSKKYSYTTDEFIDICNIVHNNKYKYLSEYEKGISKIKIECPIHGIFEQRASYHIAGHGCPMCKSSKGELFIKKFLEDYNIIFETQKRFSECRDKYKLPFDFYIPIYNTCIEFNGRQHYQIIEKWGGVKGYNTIKSHDEIKRLYCKENNINFITIKYDDIILDILNSFLKNNNII